MRIDIKNLYKSYGDTPVLENFSLSVDSEKPVCFMGMSGRGKTTLFSIIMGLMKADKGSVTGTEGKRFSAVFQEDRLCDELSALMNLAIVTETPDKDKISELLLSMGLDEDEIRRPVTELSGGQKRRVAIMRAMVSDSDIVMMDEPFKGLDDATREQVIHRVKDNLKGRMLMVITHDESDAEMLGAEIVYI
ncbi:MAG: ABC transporter ATP-binding protein [Oscillospiraceae bacterium]|nr:ABC transporter ATP-binding protein [Oscillospiraceae bacterium]